MVTGIIIVGIFVVIAALMIAKKLPTVLALPIMAVLIAFAAGLPLKGEEGILTYVIPQGALKLSGTYVAILFSCWLSRILYRTGVSATIIKKAAEFGGDKPFIVSVLLCAASVILFMVLYGTGAVAMVGAIVLPIMMSVGVAPVIACNSFLAAMTAGYMINPANIAAITNITGEMCIRDRYGTVVPIITPFDENGEVDIKSLENLTEYIVQSGLQCLYPCGTTGEMCLLSLEERKKVVETVVRKTAGRIPVFAQVGAVTLADTIELARHAVQAGRCV